MARYAENYAERDGELFPTKKAPEKPGLFLQQGNIVQILVTFAA